MKKTIPALFFVLCAVVVHAQKKPVAKTGVKSPAAKSTPGRPVLKNMVDSASYAIGISEAKFMKQQGITKINSAIVAKAIEDVMNSRPTVLDDAQCNSAVMGYINTIQLEKSKDVIVAGQRFLMANKNKPGITVLPSGLQYEVIKEGSGIKPSADDSVTCHYAGSLIDGTEFESSYKRGEPITFNLRGVIAGWTEGLQHMTVGSKYRFFIPYQLAYGTQTSGPIPGGSSLVFVVELLDVKKKP